MANEFINRVGKDWNRYLWRINRTDRTVPAYKNQKLVDEAIDILRPHLDRYNTTERMLGEEIWKEIGTYTGVKVW